MTYLYHRLGKQSSVIVQEQNALVNYSTDIVTYADNVYS